jgi:hypothetical protein
MLRTSKRIGPPFKPAKKGQRYALGLRVRAELKAQIDKAARASGRTQSQEAEALLERCLVYDGMLRAMNTTLADIAKGSLEAALHRQGYTPVHSPHGKIWLPPGHPGIQRTGFVPQEEEH